MNDGPGGDQNPSDLVDEPDVVAPTQMVYLDLDGDGVPGAVQTTSTVEIDPDATDG